MMMHRNPWRRTNNNVNPQAHSPVSYTGGQNRNDSFYFSGNSVAAALANYPVGRAPSFSNGVTYPGIPFSAMTELQNGRHAIYLQSLNNRVLPHGIATDRPVLQNYRRNIIPVVHNDVPNLVVRSSSQVPTTVVRPFEAMNHNTISSLVSRSNVSRSDVEGAAERVCPFERRKPRTRTERVYDVARALCFLEDRFLEDTKKKGGKNKQNVKVELCRYARNGQKCPYQGSKSSSCNFAHSDEEFERNLLLLLVLQRGVDDMFTDRNLPCPDFIMAGSCPFGARCSRIHDPRWACCTSEGGGEAWHRHSEMPREISQLDDPEKKALPVNSAYHLIRDSIYEGGTYMRSFTDLFANYVNAKNFFHTSVLKQVQVHVSPVPHVSHCSFNEETCVAMGYTELKEEHVLAIAIKMHHDPHQVAQRIFTYQPDHVLAGQPCMVLSYKVFDVPDGAPIHVHKIAFGPAGKDATCGGGHRFPPVALWFNLDKTLLIKDVQKVKERHKELHKSYAAETLTKEAAMTLRGTLGISEHYNYDKEITLVHLKLMKIQKESLRFLFSNMIGIGNYEELENVLYIEANKLHQQLYSLKSFYEECSVTVCKDRSTLSENEIKSLQRRNCTKQVTFYHARTSRGGTKPIKKTSHILESFANTLADPMFSSYTDKEQVQSGRDKGGNFPLCNKNMQGGKVLASVIEGLKLKRAVWGTSVDAATNVPLFSTSRLDWDSWCTTILYPEFEHLLKQHKKQVDSGTRSNNKSYRDATAQGAY